MTDDVFSGNPTNAGSLRGRSMVFGKDKMIGSVSETENLRALLGREARFYPPLDYFPSIPCSTKEFTESITFNEAWRRNFCDWFYELVDHYGYDREVVSVALYYLDRTVAIEMTASSELLPKRKFQLIAVTCLYIAIKLHGEANNSEASRSKIKIRDYVELSHGFFPVEVIEVTELQVLNCLEWRVNPPTCLKFVAYLIRLCPKWSWTDGVYAYTDVVSGIYDVARYLTELSVSVSAFSTCKNSITAYACIYCAIEALKYDLLLPADVQMVFLDNMEKVTGLFPEMKEVQCARLIIKDICPSIFDGGELPSEFIVGRTTTLNSPKSGDVNEVVINSPVSLNDISLNGHSGHKRNRTYGGEGSILQGSNSKARRVLDA